MSNTLEKYMKLNLKLKSIRNVNKEEYSQEEDKISKEMDDLWDRFTDDDMDGFFEMITKGFRVLDDLDKLVVERTEKNPQFPDMVKTAEKRQKKRRDRK